MAAQWMPGVNALGSHGRGTFAEFRSVHDLEADFARSVEHQPEGAKGIAVAHARRDGPAVGLDTIRSLLAPASAP
jgi:hypothetical protein